MELDSSIKPGKRPLTCLDVEQAREFVGKECIFSDFFFNYLDIEKFNIDNDNEHTGILSIDDNLSDYIFKNDRNKSCYRFILPCEWVEQKNEITFEPYTLETFEKEFNIGDVVVFREKDDDSAEGKYYKCMYSGYIQKPENKFLILLGGWLFNFTDLFFLYEIYRNGTWEPFGRKISEG